MDKLTEERIRFWGRMYERTLFPEAPVQVLTAMATSDGHFESRAVIAKDVADQALDAFDAKFRLVPVVRLRSGDPCPDTNHG